MQDAQKGQTSHPPNPGAPRRTFSQARPQRTIPFSIGVAGMIPLARPTGFLEPRVAPSDVSTATCFFSILLGIGSRSRQACLLREAQHEVHGLNGLACGTFHKIIQRGHRNH